MIGVIIDQSANIKLPFPVKIRAGSVVGPSAGLAFALEIMEKLGRNVDRGYKVAATGELQLDGSVLPIGGVEQKTIEAKRSHVDILLVPAGDNAAEARKFAGDHAGRACEDLSTGVARPGNSACERLEKTAICLVRKSRKFHQFPFRQPQNLRLAVL